MDSDVASAQPHQPDDTPPESSANQSFDLEDHDGAWRQTAGFSVFFETSADQIDGERCRTRLYHDESDQTLTVSGSQPADWIGWIEQRRVPAIATLDESRSRYVRIDVNDVSIAGATTTNQPGATDVVVQVMVRVTGTIDLTQEVGAAIVSAAIAALIDRQ